MAKIDPRLIDWEDEDFDSEEETFKKLTHKTKMAGRREEEVIRRKRREKEKMRQNAVE